VYYFGQSLGHVVARLHGAAYAIGLVALLAIVAWLAHYRRRHRTGLGRRAPG
jgi:hypothetical protein